jgi:arylsulfatase A-like enzyme
MMGVRPVEIEQAKGPLPRLGPLDVLILAAWCGLAAGELEVAVRVAQRALSSTNRLYQLTRHFVWLVPVVNGLLFLAFGAACALAIRQWPRRAGWLSLRLVLIGAFLPTLSLLGHGIHWGATLILAMGFAASLGPILERALVGPRHWLCWSSAILIGAVVLQLGWLVGGDTLKQWREAARPLPPPDSPNVLLIVLDTVRADHLSVYGYARPTTPNLEILAQGGIRFDQARAAAPWTLASHATLFTGRWPHELGSRWMHPMRDGVPTLAEYLGSSGYATAGFVGNTFYCAYDSGLDRGFTHYEDYRLDWVSALRAVHLVDLTFKAVESVTPALAGVIARGPAIAGFEKALRPFILPGRKDARVVNREFVRWLTRDREPRRPYFAFLNYLDAHGPYQVPPGSTYRFGRAPATDADFLFLTTVWPRIDKSKLTRKARAMAMDAYDSCIASIDDRLGELFGDLQRLGLLDRSIVIVTADHGEGFGEHELYDHGESLYRPEIRVPLLISIPPGLPSGRIVDQVVSLCDIPATIADLIGTPTDPPFPGRSLARLWRTPSASPPPVGDGDELVLSELTEPNPTDPSHGRSPARRGPLISLAEGDFVYIRNEGDGKEQLFNEREDPQELFDRAQHEQAQSIVKRFRERSRRLVVRLATLLR